jgi:aminoglycoside phosphotransferase (APT) family kinase protein
MTDLDALLYSLRLAFPELNLKAPLHLLGEGFYSTAVQSPDGMVFRIGRTPRAAAGYARESAVLPALNGLLPAAVPQPRHFVPAGGVLFPFGLIAYPGLPGDPLNPELLTSNELERAARQVADIILALQRIPPQSLGLVDDFPARRSGWVHQSLAVLPALRLVLNTAEYAVASAWWDTLLADAEMGAYQPVFQHGDLWYGNLLADGAHITAVLDWSEMGAGDPALDFAPQFYPGETFFHNVMEAFERGGGTLDKGYLLRLGRLQVLREFDGLEYSILQHDDAEFTDSVGKIRREMGFEAA